MSAYLLRVKAGERVLAQGTAWLLAPDLAVTAFHVVGKLPARAWLHEIPGSGAGVTYALRDGEGEAEVDLEPAICDLGADVAMLRCRVSPAAPRVLSLAEAAPPKGSGFDAEGYPAFQRGDPFTVSGRITDVRGEVSSTALQLLFDQGTDATWAGLSGSAVRVGDRVAGVVTRETTNVATGWAASFEAVRRLSRFLGARDLGAAVCELLQKLYAEPEHLLDLRAELGWPADAGAGADRGAIAAALSQRAMLDGADGLVRLLDAVGHDHPASGEVGPLRARVLAVVRRPEVAGARSRAERVREIVQVLREPNGAGVAVLAPQGFQGRAVVEEVLRQLDRPGETLLPVRFVPERRTAGDERLYTTLLRDLRWAAPEPWRAVLGRGGAHEVAAVLHAQTGGHPALVDELLREHPEDALAGDAEAIAARILDGAHVAGLRRIVEEEASLQGVLRALAAAGDRALPRGKKRKEEARLLWLGVIKDAGARSWAWVAPAMREFAGEWG